jgi:hemoglobin-like flavoprotein
LRQINTRGRASADTARMNTELIAQTWQALGERQAKFVAAFYERFFERFPGYRRFFPRELGEAHLQKMVATVALLADLAEDTGDVAPRLHRLGAAHRPFELAPRDFGNFKAVFIEVLREHSGSWSPEAAKAWSDAFEEVLFPLMREGVRA